MGRRAILQMPVKISKSELKSLLTAQQSQPHSLLGMHAAKDGRDSGLVVRALIHDAAECSVIDARDPAALMAGGAARWPMKLVAPAGLFEVFIPGPPEVFRYQLRVKLHSGAIRQAYDPYAFLPTLGEQDVYLFNEGNEHRIYQKLGAHVRVVDRVAGVSFAVWAPTAKRVSVVGDFNRWDGRYHPMRSLGASGVWELFIPGLGEGEVYKYEIWDHRGLIRLKTDPYGTAFEGPPNNASIVCNARRHHWHTRAAGHQAHAGLGPLQPARRGARAFGKQDDSLVFPEDVQDTPNGADVRAGVPVHGNNPDGIQPPADNAALPQRLAGKGAHLARHLRADDRRIEGAGVVRGDDESAVTRDVIDAAHRGREVDVTEHSHAVVEKAVDEVHPDLRKIMAHGAAR